MIMKKLSLGALNVLIVALLVGTPALANGNHGHGKQRLAERIDHVLTHVPRTFQFTNIRNIASSPTVAGEGGAFLVRSKHGVQARLMIGDLMPGHAFTTWFVFFNRPGSCASNPCADTDLATSGGAVHYGSAAISGANGTINVTLDAAAGGPPAGAAGNPNLPERGLKAGRGFVAEVHIVLVDHGVPATADFTADDPDVPGTWGWELTHPLPPGPNWVRAAIFLPEN